MNNYENTFQTWDKLASAYEDKFMDMDLYNDTYDLFCDLIKKCAPQILEIGCGPGNITKYLLSKRPDFQIDAIDVAPAMIKLAKINNPTANFAVMDCRDIDKLTSKFDAIICGFCMPYLSKAECAKLIHDCSYLLNNDGVLYFSAIEGAYDKSKYETSSNGLYKMFVHYHEEGYLKEALRKNNFELIDLQRKNYPMGNETSSTHIIFIAKKIQ